MERKGSSDKNLRNMIYFPSPWQEKSSVRTVRQMFTVKDVSEKAPGQQKQRSRFLAYRAIRGKTAFVDAGEGTLTIGVIQESDATTQEFEAASNKARLDGNSMPGVRGERLCVYDEKRGEKVHCPKDYMLTVTTN